MGQKENEPRLPQPIDNCTHMEATGYKSQVLKSQKVKTTRAKLICASGSTKAKWIYVSGSTKAKLFHVPRSGLKAITMPRSLCHPGSRKFIKHFVVCNACGRYHKTQHTFQRPKHLVRDYTEAEAHKN